MLYKYKKVYQETNEDVVETQICYKLIDISFTNPADIGINTVDIKMKKCSDSSVISFSLDEDIPTNINECVIINSIKIANADISGSTYITTPITEAEVQDAILNNSGVLEKFISDNSVFPAFLLGAFIFNFTIC